MTKTVKATEIRVGDVIEGKARVERVRIAKRVSVQMQGYAGNITYPVNSYVRVMRP